MKRFLGTLTLMSLMAVVGCGDKSKPGGPGTTGTDKNQPAVGQGDNTFTLDVPNSVSLKQGESKEESITIKRGKNFDQDVALKFDNLPAGVTVTPADAMLRKSEEKALIRVVAAADAAIGDFTVKIRGHPATGADANSEMKITVKKLD